MIQAVRYPKRRHKREETLRASAIVLGYLTLAYWFTGWQLPRLLRTNPGLNFYVVQPAIWTGLAVLAYHSWRRLSDRPRFSQVLTGIAFAVGVFYVSVLIIAGVVAGFVQSPSAGRLINYPKNGLFIVTLLLGVETARAYLFWAWRRISEHFAFFATTLLFFAVVIPAAQWTAIDGADPFLRIVLGRWLPALALSALATWLVEYGGLGPSFSYRFALLAFVWFSPILPDLDWPALMLIGTLTPLVSVGLVKSIYSSTAEGESRGVGQDEEPSEVEPTRWWPTLVVTALGGLLIALLFTGTLGVRPFVVAGISMEPAYERGDVAIIAEDVLPASLQVNDVIKFDLGNREVVHRIVAVDEGQDGLVFTTQGDNVSRPDPPVTADRIEGKVVFIIPKIGRVTLWLQGR
jgi:signal peptidase